VYGQLSGQSCLAPPASPFVFVADPPHDAGRSLRLVAVDGPEIIVTRAGTVRVWRVREAVPVSVVRPQDGGAPIADFREVRPPIAHLIVDGFPWEPFATSAEAKVTVEPGDPLLALGMSIAAGGPTVGLRYEQQASGDHVELQFGLDTFTADLAHGPLANPVDLDRGDGVVRIELGPAVVTGPTGSHEVELDVTMELGLIVVAPSL
jgi:hypothetical protein